MKNTWQSKNLGDVCDVIGGGTPSKAVDSFFGGHIPWATVRDMRSDIIEDTECKITDKAVKSSSTNIIPKGNVVIATRVGLGKVCLLKHDTAINQDLRGILPKNAKELSVAYLFRWLHSIAHVIVAEGTGATVQGVKLPFIKALKIPLPPLAEQKRIVKILDKAFASIVKAKANAEKNLANSLELFESYLQDVFGMSTLGWKERAIEEIAMVINGYSFTSHDFSSKNHVKSIKITNVGVNQFVEDPENLLPKGFADKHMEYKVKKGDIVLALTRTLISSGLKVAIVPESYDGALLNQRVAAIIVNEDVVNKKYLYSFLGGNFTKKYVLSHVNTLMQPNLSIIDLKRLPVPVPSIKQQHQIVAKLDALSGETKRLEEIYRKKIANLYELKKALLQKAFKGEL